MLRSGRLLQKTTVRSSRAPRTQVRRIALISDQSANIGDYPQLPKVNKQTRSELAKWDNQQDRRNFGETLHEEEDVLTVFSPDEHNLVSPGTALLQVAIFLTCSLSIYVLAKATFKPLEAERRKYPYGGLNTELAGNAARS